MRQFPGTACTAWNCAHVPEEVKQAMLDQCALEYQRWNPQAGDQECQAIREQMAFLIKMKLKKYPHVIKQIVSCELQVINGQDHITVASLRESR